jgi:hypothetical protein
MRNTLRVLKGVVIAFAVAAPQMFAANPALAQFQRVASVSKNGSMVKLELEDGSTLDVAATQLRIVSTSPMARRPDVSPADLSSMSGAGSLQAAACVRYRADGTVVRVRVRVFASDAETRAFLQKVGDRQARDH